jgi:8-oxo-dGTP diphosphatase
VKPLLNISGGDMPIATVAAIIKNAEGEILLTRRNVEPFKGQWCLPGGHIDKNEKALEAVVREVKEETGLDFEAEFFAYADEIIADYDWHAVVLVFAGKGTGTISAQEGEVADIEWYSLNEACSLPLAFEHDKILDEYASQIRD